MKLSTQGRKHLIEFEGIRLRAYADAAGKRTIGVGHLLTARERTSGQLRIGDESIPWKHGITLDETQALLDQDLARIEAAVSERVQVPLAQHQFDALASFVFNVGPAAFARSTLLRLLNEGQYAAVPGQLRRWVRAGGKVLPGLQRRRESEIAIWSGPAKIQTEQ